MKQENRRLRVLLILILLLSAVLPVHADMFPQPQVTITIKNLPEGRIYATLLAKEEESGPYISGEHVTSWEYINLTISDKIWQAFNNYAKEDEYHFLGFIQNITHSQTLTWVFYPPQDFKLVIYHPTSGLFLSSEKVSRYAFSSLFSAECTENGISLTRTLPVSAWIWGLLGRFLLTILVELGVAMIFRLWKKRHIKVIVIANLITQTVLNFILMRFPPLSRLKAWSYWTLLLVLCEIIVFVTEAIIYTKKLDELEHTKPMLVLYAFVANLASLGLCFVFSALFPALF